MEYEFVPCKQENYKTINLYGSEKYRVLNDLKNYSINTTILDNGKLLSNNY